MNSPDVEKVLGKIESYYLKKGDWKGQPISDENMEILRNFDSFNAAKGLAAETRRNYLKSVKAAMAWATERNKPLKKLTKQDMANFIAELSNDKSANFMRVQRINLKAFFQWLHGLEVTRDYPECVRWLRPGARNQNNIRPETLIKKEEMEAMLAACRCQRDRALLMLIWERGPRPHEILSMRIADVQPTQYGLKVLVGRNEKTGARPLPLIDAAPDLQLWLNMHPLRHDPGVKNA